MREIPHIPGRQTLVWFREEETHDARVMEWARRGWPAMLRRGAASRGKKPLGIALPGKCRIAFEAAPVSFRPPPELNEALHAAPCAWQPALKTISSVFGECNLTVRVYGSLMWQHLTGQPYLTEASDLDLLCVLPELSLLPHALQAFGLAATVSAPFRLDGEIFLPGYGWAAWRELLERDCTTILCKLDQGEQLVDRKALPLD